MRTGSSIATSRDANRSQPQQRGLSCCCHSTTATNPAKPLVQSASSAHVRRSLGGLLTLCGMLGWLSVPKCPLCLTAYIAIGSGLTLSFAQSQILLQLCGVAAAGMILAGVWHLSRPLRIELSLRFHRKS